MSRKTAKYTVFVFIAVIILCAVAVFGTTPGPEIIRISPTALQVNGGGDNPGDGWALFDRDTTTAFAPSATVRVTVDLPSVVDVSAISVYGASSYDLTINTKVDGKWEALKGLGNMTLSNAGETWNRYNMKGFSAKEFQLEFTPDGKSADGGGVLEVEIWGNVPNALVDGKAVLSLQGLAHGSDVLDVLEQKPQHVVEFASSEDLSAPSNIKEEDPPHVVVNIDRSPVVFKRAYLLFESKTVLRPIDVRRRINGLSWSKGYNVVRPAGEDVAWQTLTEEINPAWLKAGENTIDFRSLNGTAKIRNVRIVAETESGWNALEAASDTELFDGDPLTSYQVPAELDAPYVEMRFDRKVQVTALRFHVPGPMNLNAKLQYLDDEGNWGDLLSGWNINLTPLVAGWNEVGVEALAAARSVRLVFDTSSLKGDEAKAAAAVINEIQVRTSPAGSLSEEPRVVVSFPRDGEYFDRTAYVQGFVVPEPGAKVKVEEKSAGAMSTDGAFGVAISKDETKYKEQATDESWEVLVASSYTDGLAGATKLVELYRNAYLNGKYYRAGGGQIEVDKGEKHTEKVSPGQAKKIKFGDLEIDIPAGAVDNETDITIIPLSEEDLAKLDPGMVNVTYPAAGYRFLPHGIHFKKPIHINFGYAPALLLKGQDDDEVNMYFYHEKARKWMQLKKVRVDRQAHQVVSETDHFTDMINATLVVPEHPEALTYNPTSIKDIKAADPGAEINQVEPPKANNKGDANLSYPIQVPPGRKGMQPQLAVQYNSSGGNGWMGLGWNIPMRSVSIDTRWGVPRYSSSYESEDYLLEGEPLLLIKNGEAVPPISHGGGMIGRQSDDKDEQEFRTRVEGQFRKIIRHGTAPSGYSWEVTDKDGVKYFYGNTPDSVLAGPNGIFQWALSKVIDPNGNTMVYTYHSGTINPGGVATNGKSLYLKSIRYTGNETKGEDGYYEVRLNLNGKVNGSNRPDVSIDARAGFKVVTAELLDNIEVWAGTQKVRSYVFNYEEGEFKKTRLASVTQKGASDTDFHTHSFDYYNDLRADLNSSMNGFNSNVLSWNTKDGGLGAGGQLKSSALGASKGESAGWHLHLGFSIPATKFLSFGGKISQNMNRSEGVVALVDVDGDNLPDKVIDSGGTLKYRKNTSGPGKDFEDIAFSSSADTLSGAGDFMKEESQTFGGGLGVYFVAGSVLIDKGFASSTQSVFFDDVNGDGLVDIVNNGTVLFNYINSNGVPSFNRNSYLTEAPLGFGTFSSGAINATGMLPDDLDEIEKDITKKNPLMDALRIWRAPYNGKIKITGSVALQNTVEADPEYDSEDGVRVSIQKNNNTPAWANVIAADDFEPHTPDGVDNIPVVKGDYIYFRVGSLYDGAYDDVSWDPVVSYIQVDEPELLDVNNLHEYRYQASDDFTYAGRTMMIKMPFDGEVKLSGTIKKNAVTTDDVEFTVRRVIRKTNDEIDRLEKIRSRFIDREATGTVMDLDEFDPFSVSREEELLVTFESDSNIDLTQIQWLPLEQEVEPEDAEDKTKVLEAETLSKPIYMYYVSAVSNGYGGSSPEQPGYDPTQYESDLDDNDLGMIANMPSDEIYNSPVPGVEGSDIPTYDDAGNILVDVPVSYGMDFYPDNDLTAPQKPWVAPKDGFVLLTPHVSVLQKVMHTDGDNNYYVWEPIPDLNTHVTFTAKRRGERLMKKVVHIVNGVAPQPYSLTDVLEVKKGDEIFYDLTIPDLKFLYMLRSKAGSPTFYSKMELRMVYGCDVPWRTPITDTVRVTPSLWFQSLSEEEQTPYGSILFLVRKGDEILDRRVIGWHSGSGYALDDEQYSSALSLLSDSEKGDDLYVDFLYSGYIDPDKYGYNSDREPISEYLNVNEVRALHAEALIYNAPAAGTYRFTPALDFDFDGKTPSGKIRFRVIHGSNVLGTSVIEIKDGVVPDLDNHSIFALASKGKKLKLEFMTKQPGLLTYLKDYGVEVWRDYQGKARKPWTAENDATVSISPDLSFDFNGDTPSGMIEFAVTKNGTVVERREITVSSGELRYPDSLDIDLEVDEDDVLEFYFATEDGELAQYVSEEKALLTIGEDQSEWDTTFEVLLSIEPGMFKVRNLPFKSESDDPLEELTEHRNIDQGMLPKQYRGWAYLGYNDTIHDENDEEYEKHEFYTEKIDHNLVIKELSRNDSDYRNVREVNPHEEPVFMAIPVPLKERWISLDKNWSITGDTITSSRLGADYVHLPTEEEVSYPHEGGDAEPDSVCNLPSGFSTITGVPRLSMSDQTSYGAGIGVQISYAQSPSERYLDMRDLNGDRFPDIVGMGRVQYTLPNGGRDPLNSGSIASANVMESENIGLNIGSGGSAPSLMLQYSQAGNDGDTGGKGDNIVKRSDSSTQDKAGQSVSGSGGGSLNEVKSELMDINGDGLADRVTQVGGAIKVQLNLGYSFDTAYMWDAGHINDGVTLDGNVSVAFNDGSSSMAGSVSLGTSTSSSRHTLIDMNGDGLLDSVTVTGFNPNLNDLRSMSLPSFGGNNFKVGFNTGTGFASAVTWNGGITHSGKKNVSSSQAMNMGIGGRYTYYAGPLCIVGICFVNINGGINIGLSMSHEEYVIKDVNGDGYPDHLESTSDNSLRVAPNMTGKTNLLKKVTRPLGSTMELEYVRSGNTYDQPQSRWIMSKVTVDDNYDYSPDHSEDNSPNMVTTYEYQNGRYNRREREFYGYETVIERQMEPDNVGSYTSVYLSYELTFSNTNFYNKGLLVKETLYKGDVGGPKYTETVNSYSLVDALSGNRDVVNCGLAVGVYFPRLDSTEKSFYEGGTGHKSTTNSFEYDGYGNVTVLKDSGDNAMADDDLWAGIDYDLGGALEALHIVNRPKSITVRKQFHDGDVLRHREGAYNQDNGNLETLSSQIDTAGSPFAVTTLDYTDYGILNSVTGPVNYNGEQYSLTFGYDTLTNTYINHIHSSFEYDSYADYDYRFGKPTLTTDINGNDIHYFYDEFGRTTKIYGPYENNTTGLATIGFDYSIPGLVPTKDAPAWAYTSNKERWDSTETIDTVIIADGLDRVIQTKKEAEIYKDGSKYHGMAASGGLKFDAFGRTIRKGQPHFQEGVPSLLSSVFVFDISMLNDTEFQYDVLGRIIEIDLPDGGQVSTKHDISDNLFRTLVTTKISETDGIRNSIKATYKDTRELIRQVKEKLGGDWIITDYDYNAMSEITSVKQYNEDGREFETLVGYDLLGRRLYIDNPDMGKVSYIYDLAGNLIRRVTPNLRAADTDSSIKYEYDQLRLVKIDYPDSADVEYTYGTKPEHKAFNGLGRIIHVENGDMKEDRYYGKLGETVKRVKSIRSDVPSRVWPVFTTQYEFDSFGRMRTLVYPDGEVLTYTYDKGGQLETATGRKDDGKGGNHVYEYLKDMGYDEFSQLIHMELGNGVVTDYTYYPKNRRLKNLHTASADVVLQNVTYTYDLVGDILKTENNGFIARDPDVSKTVTQIYQYDDLQRLLHADGTYERNEDSHDQYINNFSYDIIGNMLGKVQQHEIYHPSDGSISPRPQTTYNLNYEYDWKINDAGSVHNGATAPHIASHIGGKTYKYDLNGNMTKWIDDQTKREMVLTWNEENQLVSTEEQGKLTIYRYDDAGMRIIKRGKYGEVLYVNENYSLRNGEVGSKHVFAGSTRIATKLTMKEQKLNASKATYDKSEGGHNGRVPEKSRGNHFGWGEKIDTGAPVHESQGNAYGHEKQTDRGHEIPGQLKKLEKAGENAESAKGKGKSKDNGNANANAQDKSNPHDYKYDTDLPGKSEKGLENALAHGKGHKYGIYKRLARRGLIVNSSGDIVPIGSSGDDVSEGDNDGSDTTPTVGNATGAVPDELGIYYYQGDHLGSSNIITDRKGRVYEHVEYFPYGETWVDEQRNTTNLPYKFTGKELDPETGMYYFGARYYEPVTSRWISADPAFRKYIPYKVKNQEDLPSLGGIYRPVNINAYAFVQHNPLVLTDPNGKKIRVHVDNVIVGKTTAYKQKGQVGPIEVPIYNVTVTHVETGETKTFQFTRDATKGGKIERGKYGTSHEAPPGHHRGEVRPRGGHPRLQMWDEGVTQDTSRTGGVKGHVKNPEDPNKPREALQFHGIGMSEGCLMSENAAEFNKLVNEWNKQDKAKKQDERIDIQIDDRNYFGAAIQQFFYDLWQGIKKLFSSEKPKDKKK